MFMEFLNDTSILLPLFIIISESFPILFFGSNIYLTFIRTNYFFLFFEKLFFLLILLIISAFTILHLKELYYLKLIFLIQYLNIIEQYVLN